MTINKTLLALALCIALAGATARSHEVQKPPSPPQYFKEKVTLYGEDVLILEDHKRNRLCYITTQRTGHLSNFSSGISCGPLNPR